MERGSCQHRASQARGRALHQVLSHASRNSGPRQRSLVTRLDRINVGRLAAAVEQEACHYYKECKECQKRFVHSVHSCARSARQNALLCVRVFFHSGCVLQRATFFYLQKKEAFVLFILFCFVFSYRCKRRFTT